MDYGHVGALTEIPEIMFIDRIVHPEVLQRIIAFIKIIPGVLVSRERLDFLRFWTRWPA
jgi:hypothetical protein